MFKFDLLVHVCPGNKSLCPVLTTGLFRGTLLRSGVADGLTAPWEWDALEATEGTHFECDARDLWQQNEAYLVTISGLSRSLRVLKPISQDQIM